MALWHTLSIEEVEREIGTDSRNGLSASEVLKRRIAYGSNSLPQSKSDSWFKIFLRQFQSPLIYVLVFASFIVYFTGNIHDSLIILVVLVFNAIVGAIQEGRAQNTLDALRSFTKSSATVLRDGEEIILEDIDLVPGDILVLQEGEKVAADGRIIESNSLRINEAALTGESVPVHKEKQISSEKTVDFSHAANMVLKGTTVTGGNGKAIVIATGIHSEIGRISQVVKEVDTEIPLKKDIRELSNGIVWGVLIIAVVLFFAGLSFGRSPIEMLAAVVALSVSMVPEGLPIVLTLVLASGVWRMAKRNALVKKLQAVEALGQAKIIAVDKTGTLTKNEMVVRQVLLGDQMFFVGGIGYEPKGEVKLGDDVIDPGNHPDLLLAGKIAALSSNARVAFREDTQIWQVAGDPTEAALAAFGDKIGFRKNDLEHEMPRLAELPFDYRVKYHVVAHSLGKKQFVAITGAPEAVLAVSTKIRIAGKDKTISAGDKERLERELHHMLRNGYRAIAFGHKELSITKKDEELKVADFIFDGFFAVQDALRPEVPEAMARARAAGIRVVMITGDHKITAVAIAKQAGIWQEGDEVVLGEDIDRSPATTLANWLPKVSVFARVTPEHKMKIIAAYRHRGEVVAMTGDGVNDAPSLVAADLGVAMGRIGTEVAKEAADIILLDDNFGTIVSAVEEGRNMYVTIKKTILYLFSTSIGELLAVSGAIFMGLPLPLLPAQILWLNLVTDPFLGWALALEPKDKNLLTSEFHQPNRHLIDRLAMIRTVFMALPMMFGSLLLFTAFYESDMARALTLSLTTLAMIQWFNAFNCRSDRESIFQMDLLANKSLIIAVAAVFILQLFAVYHPFFQSVLGTTSLSLNDWLLAFIMALGVIGTEELRKAVVRFIYPQK